MSNGPRPATDARVLGLPGRAKDQDARISRRANGSARWLRVAAALAALSLAAAPAAALASGPARRSAAPTPAVFGIGPSGANKVDGRPYYYYLAQPGSTLSDHVAVVNIGTAPITLSVYATDAGNSADGSFAFPPAAVEPVDAGSWVHVQLPHGRTTITLRGRSTAFLPVTLTVPPDASPGDHAGALVASLQGEVRNSQGQLIHLDQRVATRMFFRISGPLHPRLAIERLGATYHGSLNPFAKGEVTVTYTVHNTGNVKLGGTQLVDVSGLFGTTAAVDVPVLPLLLPGGSARQTVHVHGVLPRVWMSADVTITAAGLSGDLDPHAGPWTASTRFWAVPWSLLLLLLLILLVLGTLAYERRRRRRRSAPGEEKGPEPPTAREPKPTPTEPTPEGVPS